MPNILINPISAVEFMWAISSMFSKDDQTKDHGTSVNKKYQDLLSEFLASIKNMSPSDKESASQYATTLMSSVPATLKNLQTYMKYRDNRVKEVLELRDEQICSINRMKTFGLSFENAFPKIASSTAIGGISGLSITGLLKGFNMSQLQQDVLLLAFFGIGYLITEFVVLPLTISKKKKTINITNDKAKEHYDQYIGRCKTELQDLFNILEASFLKIPGTNPEMLKVDGQDWTADLILPENIPIVIHY